MLSELFDESVEKVKLEFKVRAVGFRNFLSLQM